jgi:uncharacterized protein (TIGR02265 family)
MSDKSMRECFKHTDLEWRLAQIPDSAGCRGVFLNMLDERACEFGPEIMNEYRDFFRIYQFSGFRLYPVKDYLMRIVKLAELRFGGPDIYKGIFEIQAAAFPSWRRTLVGRTAFAVLGVQFDSILRVTGISVSKAVNYAECRILRDGPMHFTANFSNEYMYIEHAMAGALTGVARACEVPVSLDVRLRDPFNGEIGITVLDEKAAYAP